ncbi:GtrA family protein [Nocardia cyriacigeorgica]|uniref:GtrA/DPMS transmembrane domain-containing protein n=1 Tax=Nocardia cyriacigeorgica (strain GUH-2) TaxID=1127134 RepID=H6R0Y0_NOCCG|nr:GtrA family protein [Nocardia cyriacigeorgica]MBF6287276.1 GtrA family protein [Nocardia cyriacigeorgica]MBF6428417.1 GtrA family protein [Nocardia cyriacigeorgica]CCF62952.1 conserved membrane protein of unknown function; putative GtrA domain [Nocardia cyriacigeorgica GUH-2]BDT86584.1 hypothetical protein FMUAM8_23480 [Nocardia cyriacigeorgica]BDU06092.1 hypothetical protein FMUBM48_23550 [Nocardia cyriacigeorgica]
MSGAPGAPDRRPPGLADGPHEHVSPDVAAPVAESVAFERQPPISVEGSGRAFDAESPAPVDPSAPSDSRSAGQVSADSPPADPGPLLRLVRRQELAFAVVGGFNTLLGIVLTVAWLTILGDGVPPSVAVVAAYCVSVVVAFVLHRTLVFRVRGHLLRDFLAFVAVNSGGLLMNVVLLELAVTVLGFPEKPAAVVVMGFVAVVSFFGHRHISFRRRVG